MCVMCVLAANSVLWICNGGREKETQLLPAPIPPPLQRRCVALASTDVLLAQHCFFLYHQASSSSWSEQLRISGDYFSFASPLFFSFPVFCLYCFRAFAFLQLLYVKSMNESVGIDRQMQTKSNFSSLVIGVYFSYTLAVFGNFTSVFADWASMRCLNFCWKQGLDYGAFGVPEFLLLICNSNLEIQCL